MKQTIIQKMTFKIWLKAYNYLVDNDVWLSDVLMKNNQSKTLFFKYYPENKTIVFNGTEGTFYISKIMMRIHPDLCNHNLFDYNINKIEQDFEDYTKLISKQHQKYLSKIVKRFLQKPTAHRAGDILKAFPIIFYGEYSKKTRYMTTDIMYSLNQLTIHSVSDNTLLKRYTVEIKQSEDKIAQIDERLKYLKEEVDKYNNELKNLNSERNFTINLLREKRSLVNS